MRGFFHGSILAIATGLWGLSANDASADYVIYTDTTISYSVYAVDVGRAGPRGTFSTSPTVTIVPGGDVSSGGISNVALQSFNSSTVNVVGGHVDGIWAWDSSAINVGFGGSVGGIEAYDSSRVTVGAAGAAVGQIIGRDSAQITINGGTGSLVAAAGHSSATINDGDLGAAGTTDDGQMTMNDGFVGQIGVGGGAFSMYGGEAVTAFNGAFGGTLAIFDGLIDDGINAVTGTTLLAGGQVGGQVRTKVTASGSATLLLTGGNIYGDAFARGLSELDMSGSTIHGLLQATDGSVVRISGGEIDENVFAFKESTIYVSGGTILGNLIALGGSIVQVSGGQIDDPSSLGWYVNDTSLLDIEGFGLADTLLDPRFYGFLDPNFADSPFPYNQYSEYLLSGTLLDGASVDGKLLFVENGTGARFNLINEPGGPGGGTVPEPGSIGLVAAGCVVLVVTRRFVSRTPKPRTR